jgi:gliding motility-associated-like protein
VVVSDDLGNTTTETVLVTVVLSGIDSDLDGIDDSCDDEIIDYIVVPTGFTPDGDGINDQFVIVGLEENNSVSLKVFNRYGNSVYVNDNYQNDWNGMSSFTNLDLPDGTYFYVLAIDNVDSKSGYVYINRVY